MKEVLILTRYFPPNNLVAAKRAWAWLLHFPKTGIRPMVCTIGDATSSHEQSVLRAQLRDESSHPIFVRKLLSFLEMWLPYFFPKASRISGIQSVAQEYLSQNSVDLIIATGEPFLLFKVADDLSKEFGIPWVADYRDNWSNEPTNGTLLHKLLSLLIYRPMERILLKRVRFVTTVGEFTAERIKAVYAKVDVHIIPNGHMIPSDFIDRVPSENHLEIAYFGRLYIHRNPALFLDSMRSWVLKHPHRKIKLIFYGLLDFPDQLSQVQAMAKGLENYVEYTASLRYDEMLQRGSEAHAFLMLADKSLPLTNGKMYDYLGLNRPILLVPDDRSVFNQMIEKFKCGYVGSTVEEVHGLLDMLYSQLGNPQFFRTKVERTQFSREHSTMLLANLIKQECVE